MSFNDIILNINDVSKCYELYKNPKDRLLQTLCLGYKKFYKEFWALRDINFEVRRGECIGLIGRNGAGKSTLLQIITGTLQPTTGSITVNGRIAALLELGSGFNPDFTGRENIYMNAAILGFSNKEIFSKFIDIVTFADIGDFIEQPVKNYSSGMMARLAFATQIMLEPEILIVDEALAVGDHFFQAKCYAYLRQLKKRGVTLFFVSHSPAVLQSICEKTILLEKGRMLSFGKTSEILDQYFKLSVNQENATIIPTDAIPLETVESIYSSLLPPFSKRYAERISKGNILFTDCYILDEMGKEIQLCECGKICTIRSVVQVVNPTDVPAEVGITVSTLEGVGIFAINSYLLGKAPILFSEAKTFILDFTFRVNLSNFARYRIDLGIRIPVQGEYEDKVLGACCFEVASPKPIALLFDVAGDIDIKKV